MAKVGSRLITMEELQKTLNSTPYGMPRGKAIDPGSRDVMARMLGELINAELLYHEAAALKVRERAEFKIEAGKHRKELLADKYRDGLLEKITADPAVVKKYAKEKSVSPESAKAMIVNERRKKAEADESAALFERYKVRYSPIVVKGSPDSLRDDDLLVTASAFKISYLELKPLMERVGDKNGLLDVLAQMVEREMFAARATEAGLDKDKDFLADEEGFERDLAVATLRTELENRFKPGSREVSEYLSHHGGLKFKPRKVEVLMIVAKTEEEANAIRREALNGANFYELAANRSIAPNARANAGRIGPMMMGEHPYNSVEKAILRLNPGEITSPIKGDKGYAIYKLISITPEEVRSGAEMREEAVKTIVSNKMEKHLDELYKSTKVETYPFPSD
ncbi:MAG: peptidylprolyl isomerase [Nitrospinae bacterium]|nr:peptidylprolyl isomerase [Nitrospinota bacterium]